MQELGAALRGSSPSLSSWFIHMPPCRAGPGRLGCQACLAGGDAQDKSFVAGAWRRAARRLLDASSRSAHTLAPLKAQRGRSGAILLAARAGTFQRTRPASQPHPIRSGALHTQPHATIMSCLCRCWTSAPISSKRQTELKASISSRSFHDVLAQGTKSVCDARPLRFFYFRGVCSTAI